jgi:IS30 family transposase
MRILTDTTRTTTFDNDKEFAEYEQLAVTTGPAVYVAQPDAAWQRGTNDLHRA